MAIKPNLTYFSPEKLKGGNVKKKSFISNGCLTKETVNKIFDFAYAMAFGEGYHRSKRSGGSLIRTNERIFINVLQGKFGEFAFYEWLKENNPSFIIEPPDLDVKGVGEWDGGDFLVNGKMVSVKSSSFYSNLLLLETKDYDTEGNETKFKPPKKIDVFVMTRLGVLSNHQLISLDKIFKNNTLPLDSKKFRNQFLSNVSYEISGFITNNDFKELIQQGFILHKGEVINRTTTMDADNYYIAVRDLRHPSRMLINSQDPSTKKSSTTKMKP